MNPTALIAEDEPLLAANLQAELAALWPELRVVAVVGHGAAAVSEALAHRPEVVFLDIRMPGMSGLEAAAALMEDWPQESRFPLLVFVTAYDQYALQAFEHAAVDYVLKPVQTDRLERTCLRLKAALNERARPSCDSANMDTALAQLRALLEDGNAHAFGPHNAGPASQTGSALPLTVIQASAGNAIHMVPVSDVLYIEAADKYLRVVTPEREHLIRMSLRELLPRLPAQQFWQIHRGTIVRADAIATALRDESGKVTLTLRGSSDRLVASRLYAHLFKAM
jgi:DNA-binding LytR/AlgR family response regulator